MSAAKDVAGSTLMLESLDESWSSWAVSNGLTELARRRRFRLDLTIMGEAEQRPKSERTSAVADGCLPPSEWMSAGWKATTPSRGSLCFADSIWPDGQRRGRPASSAISARTSWAVSPAPVETERVWLCWC